MAMMTYFSLWVISMSLDSNSVTSEQLGHLGLVAATIRELGIIEKIDARLNLNERKGGLVTYGRRVAAMVLNGLGFMNSRLSMTTHFFQDKPVAQLLGAEVSAEHLNDDCLGRCLDKIAEYGVTKLYSELAFEIAQEKGILGQRLHLDSTSFVLHGRYDVEAPEDAPKPAHGYSKANRPDLKQVMLSLTQGGVANIPLWMEALDGNSSDKTSFHETVKKVQAFTQKLESAPDNLCFVVDAAFYTPEKLAELNGVYWITRAPAQLKEACTWLKTPEEQLTWETFDENYRAATQTVSVYGIQQRWLLIESKHALARELQTFQRRLDRKAEELMKVLWHLGNQEFKCPHDAEKALKPLLKKLKYHSINYEVIPVKRHAGKGRPKDGSEKQVVAYQLKASLSTSLQKIKLEKQVLGRFILATNQFDLNLLDNHSVLKQYKEQSCVESGFKFIKSNTFELDSFYLKTPSRIGALMMVMTLCLMVYNFAQYHMRKCMEGNDDVLPNQVGKPVKNPTMKWIAELMNIIAVVTIKTESGIQRIVTNVKKIHRRIIAYFGQHALQIYGLPLDLKRVEINYSNYKNLLHWCEM
ncbi:TPA: IS1634 family transposase [Legionella pneumophila subsp. pneumophila]|nr:IS1634 family transposase [Legionella anisa]AWN74948.1 IS1634 family transposase [Legionella anisa]HAT9776954.1 IS1634 family transposase [Legionella pneumophila subsp. pneumophila]